MRFLPILFVLLLPSYAHAAVTISEIAWMGSSDSPNDEWIELHNTGGSAVQVDGWALKDGVNLEIPLSGTIGSGEYVVLERTDDGSAPGIAFAVYQGALANTGSTLSVYRADGSLEDRIAGGENWENVGGDNESKQTAQLTADGWKTANATPGEKPSLSTDSTQEEEDDDENTDDTSVSKKENTPVTVELQVPDITLSLAMLFPDVAYVHQNVVFDVEPAGIGKTALYSLSYNWNFGDFHTASGRQTTHAYSYPGEYVVTLHAGFGRHEQVSRKTITVLPIAFTLLFTEGGDVLLQNNAKYEVNISGFTLSGSKKLVFPKRSIILGNGSITIPREEVGGSNLVVLTDQKAEVLAVSSETMSEPESLPVTHFQALPSEEISLLQADSSDAPSNFLFPDEVTVEDGSTEKATTGNLALLSSAPKGEGAEFPKEKLPLLGLCLIVTLGIIAVLLSKKKEV